MQACGLHVTINYDRPEPEPCNYTNRTEIAADCPNLNINAVSNIRKAYAPLCQSFQPAVKVLDLCLAAEILSRCLWHPQPEPELKVNELQSGLKAAPAGASQYSNLLLSVRCTISTRAYLDIHIPKSVSMSMSMSTDI